MESKVMDPTLVLSIMAIYFGVLITISIITARGADTTTFFTANRRSPWYLVAFGMIGSSLSGLTFISVPGNVGKPFLEGGGFNYFQIVLGYLVGYWVIIAVLMPLYYRLNLISIYTYLEQRFSFWSYKTGAFVFIVSRTIGSSLRLYIAAAVLQLFLFDAWGAGVPFFVTVFITIALIWVYTFKGGVKTIVWTDSFQTIFLVAAVCVTVWQISDKLGWSMSEMVGHVKASDFSQIFQFEKPLEASYFWKQFLGGAFITITMTGMDQEIMQKNLTCKNIGEAQKNMFWFSIILVVVNILFLTLGALLYFYTDANNIAMPERSDYLFPTLALSKLGLFVGIFFLLGITASSYASADAALAGLTTSFCIDFLNFKDKPEPVKKKQKFMVHLGFSLLFLLIIVIFHEINDRSVIDAVLKIAGYTYGPLLGLFTFGLVTRRQVKDKLVPIICLLSPAISYFISLNSVALLGGYKFGIEILILNGLITFLGLWIISRKAE
jgi:Na+/proline symporter